MTNWAIDEAQEWERLAGIAAIDANFRTRIVRAMKAATFGNRAVVYVQQASDLAGTLDSSVVYWIDGVIDMAGQSIEVPAGGLNLRGWTFDVSKLISLEDKCQQAVSTCGAGRSTFPSLSAWKTIILCSPVRWVALVTFWGLTLR